MKKIAIIGMTALMGLTLTACSSSSNSSSSKTTSQASSKKAETGISLDNYKSIKVALPNGGDATSESKVKSLFGKPDQSTKTTVSGLDKQATQYTWTKVGTSLKGATVTASFYDGKAVAKAYSSATLSPNTKLTDTSVDAIKNGDTVDSVESKLGTPNAESLSGSGTLSAQIINYTSIKGKSGASVTFTFTGGKLVSTTKTSFN